MRIDIATTHTPHEAMSKVNFTVSKRAATKSGAVFREVSGSGKTTKVMSAETYHRASEKANRTLNGWTVGPNPPPSPRSK